MRRYNMKSRCLALALALLCLFGISNQAVLAAVIHVDEACSLHDAITAANTDSAAGGCQAGAGVDTISLSGDVTLRAELPVIESVIAIDGGGFTISGDNKFRIFDVTGAKLTISHLTVSEGSLGEQQHAKGGAIRLRDGALVIIRNSIFKSNRAGAGGAIYTATWNVQLEIHGSEFLENESEFGGGAIQVNGGTVNISNSGFSGNYSRGEGGAIDAMRGRLRVRNSTFSANHAYQGGAIEVDGADVSLTHLTLADNVSDFGGDGLYIRGGLVRLRNSIIDSRATGHYDCIGILEQHRGNLIADWSCRAPLGGNSLLGQYEGVPGYRPLRDGSPALDAADPAFCLKTDQLGAPRPHGDRCDIGALESKTSEPSTVSAASTCTVYVQIIAANEDRWLGSCPPGNGADTIALTEDITLAEPLPRITSEIIIEGNGHTISGGSRFPIFIVDEGNLTIRDLTLADGNARGRAGGAIRLGYKSVLEASHVAFVNNSGRLGGAIASGSRSELRVAHSSFRGNRAWSNGGAIHVGGQATISHSVLNGNSAAYDGGAIHSLWNLELDKSTLTQNRADEGGALWVARATLTQVTIANNAATQAGGIAMFSGVTLRNSIVAGNRGGDCVYFSRVAPKHEVANSLIGDGSCDAELSGDPLLGDFSSDRGYHPLLPGSPAIDAADPAHCPPTDQLGNPRPQGPGCDIGAIEFTGD